MSLQEIIPILQVAIGPVILISGVGLLLLTMTNRFARIIDRSRQLSREIHRGDGRDSASILAQLDILSRRVRIVRSAIALAALSVLLAALLVIVLFLTALLRLGFASLISGLFISCMTCLILSLGLFIADINTSLAALKLELSATRNGESR